jgi:hypothetical protein
MSVARPVILAAAVVYLLVPSPAPAQSDTRLPSRSIEVAVPAVFADAPSQQLAALARWTHDYGEWKAWSVKWRNRPEPGWLSLRARRQAPEPPAWLADLCAKRFEQSGAVGDACAAWREWTARGEAASAAAAQQAQRRQQLEAPAKTKWFERLHVDALWPMTQAGSSAIGIAGAHATVQVTKRLQVFLTPGVMMMRVPALTGGMTWTAATDWGLSYRLFDFRLPGARRASTLHVNMVRVWMLGGNGLENPGEMYLAGFSMSFKRR